MNLYSFPRTRPLRFLTRPSGFTLIELLVTVAIVGILAALLTPIVGAMRANSDATQCITNLRQVYMYLMEDVQLTEEMPAAWNGSSGWVDTKRDALRLEKADGYKAFGCPTQRKSRRLAADARTYSMNSHLVNDYWNKPPIKVPKYRDPSKVAVLTDGAVRNGSYNAAVSITYPCELPHDGKANIAFLDGHVEAVKDIPSNQNPTEGTPESIFWLGR
jgi:prepilin-type N-terminal cleavage/methylation domain-containing protein/prepilin-type processing-associated H-X9-DG protein